MLLNLDLVYTKASADVSEDKTVLEPGVKGEVLDNGNIIYSTTKDDGKTRKLILTSNHGNPLKDGYLPANDKSWRDPNTWKSRTKGLYTISKFKPRQGLF